MGTRSETVGVRPIGDGIEVRFKLHGQTMRPRLALKGTKANLLHAHRVRENVLKAIAHGTFKMADFFPDYKFLGQVEAPVSARSFGDWYEVWAKLAARDLENSSIKIYIRHMKAYWVSAWKDLDPAKITNEMILTRLAALADGSIQVGGGSDKPLKEPRRVNRPLNPKAKKGLSRKTQNNILIPLRAVFDMISRAPGAGPNPMEGIENLKVQSGNPDPFSLEEVEIALAAVEKKLGIETRDYFEFAAFAGLRPSEQIALLWNDVDLRTLTIVVRRAKVLTEEKERTKTTVERSVELNDRAAAVLQRQRARTQAAGQEVFINPATKRPWNDDQEQARDWRLILRACGVRHRPPKELRDTSVTLALAAGADPYYVAQQHGHNVATMLKSYAKWIPRADRGRNRAAINQALSAGNGEKDGTNGMG